MSNYPLNLDLRNRRCVVIGGGAVAERKVKTLLGCGAKVTVICTEITTELRQLLAKRRIEYIPEMFQPEHLDKAFLVIAATNDGQVNRRVSLEARQRGIPVNAVNDPKLCTFFVPAVVRRGDLVISISTSGKSPALARKIKENLESYLGPGYGEFVDLLGELRREVKAKYSDRTERKRAFNRILDSNVLELLNQGKKEEAQRKARQCI